MPKHCVHNWTSQCTKEVIAELHLQLELNANNRLLTNAMSLTCASPLSEFASMSLYFLFSAEHATTAFSCLCISVLCVMWINIKQSHTITYHSHIHAATMSKYDCWRQNMSAVAGSHKVCWCRKQVGWKQKQSAAAAKSQRVCWQQSNRLSTRGTHQQKNKTTKLWLPWNVLVDDVSQYLQPWPSVLILQRDATVHFVCSHLSVVIC